MPDMDHRMNAELNVDSLTLIIYFPLDPILVLFTLSVKAAGPGNLGKDPATPTYGLRR